MTVIIHVGDLGGVCITLRMHFWEQNDVIRPGLEPADFSC